MDYVKATREDLIFVLRTLVRSGRVQENEIEPLIGNRQKRIDELRSELNELEGDQLLPLMQHLMPSGIVSGMRMPDSMPAAIDTLGKVGANYVVKQAVKKAAKNLPRVRGKFYALIGHHVTVPQAKSYWRGLANKAGFFAALDALEKHIAKKNLQIDDSPAFGVVKPRKTR